MQAFGLGRIGVKVIVYVYSYAPYGKSYVPGWGKQVTRGACCGFRFFNRLGLR
jgi:hypothetical protein